MLWGGFLAGFVCSCAVRGPSTAASTPSRPSPLNAHAGHVQQGPGSRTSRRVKHNAVAAARSGVCKAARLWDCALLLALAAGGPARGVDGAWKEQVVHTGGACAVSAGQHYFYEEVSWRIKARAFCRYCLASLWFGHIFSRSALPRRSGSSKQNPLRYFV